MQRNKNKPTPTDGKLRSLVSLNQAEYDSLYVVFDQVVRKKLSIYTLKGQIRLFPNVAENEKEHPILAPIFHLENAVVWMLH